MVVGEGRTGRGREMGADEPKFSKRNGARTIRVEHPDHHADGLRVETGEVAVDEGAAELALRQVAAAVRVDGLEEGEERGVFVRAAADWGAGRRCGWWPRGGGRPVVRVRRARAEAVVGGWW